MLSKYSLKMPHAVYGGENAIENITAIIKNEVISALSIAKSDTTEEITKVTDTLLNYYNTAL